MENSGAFLNVDEIVKAAEAEEVLSERENERIKIVLLRESIEKSKERAAEMIAEVERLNKSIAEKIMDGGPVDELVLRRAVLRETLEDIKKIPDKTELQVEKIELKIKTLEVTIFHKITAVLKIERAKRVKALQDVIKTSCNEWFQTTSTLSKKFNGGVVPAGWANLREDINKTLDAVYSTTGSFFRG